jgi:hypothetical protein
LTLQIRSPENFRFCRWGDERTVKRAQTVSEDPHRRKRKFYNNFQIWFVPRGLNSKVEDDEISVPEIFHFYYFEVDFHWRPSSLQSILNFGSVLFENLRKILQVVAEIIAKMSK